MKPAAWLGLAIILGALAFGARAFVTNLTPYLSFAQAREARGVVQVIGALDKESIRHDDGKTLDFVLIGEAGDRLPVRYRAARPANFEQPGRSPRGRTPSPKRSKGYSKPLVVLTHCPESAKEGTHSPISAAIL